VSTGPTAASRLDSIEAHSFDYVPPQERHGQPRQVFYMWFGISATIFSLVTGFVGITLGLSFWWTLLSVILGNVLGALFMAFHAAQGPQLGIPQMIQSRAQFGYFGALLVVLVAVVMYVGFFASNLVLGGQSINQLASGVSIDWGIIICAVVSLVITIFGYDMIHAVNRWAIVLFGGVSIFGAFTVTLAVALVEPPGPVAVIV